MRSLEPVLQKLRDAGYRITHARRLILDVLNEHDGHLTSGEVIECVGALDPSVGRASIFRTLDLLSSLAIIRPTYMNPMTPTYVVMSPEGHHSHIICTQCDRVIEIDECHVDPLAAILQARHNVRLTGHLVEFYGVCETCLSAV